MFANSTIAARFAEYMQSTMNSPTLWKVAPKQEDPYFYARIEADIDGASLTVTCVETNKVSGMLYRANYNGDWLSTQHVSPQLAAEAALTRASVEAARSLDVCEKALAKLKEAKK